MKDFFTPEQIAKEFKRLEKLICCQLSEGGIPNPLTENLSIDLGGFDLDFTNGNFLIDGVPAGSSSSLFGLSGTNTATGNVTGNIAANTLTIVSTAYPDGLLYLASGTVQIGDVDGSSPRIRFDLGTDDIQYKAATHTVTGLIITNTDIEITDLTKGLIIKSPDSTRWRITIDNTGALITTSL